MQRLFSTFPASWPGGGLLLLRMVVAAPLINEPAKTLWTNPHSPSSVIDVAILAVGALLTVGFCTPLAALLQTIIQLWMALLGAHLVGGHTENALLGISVMMLGPGMWSLDAALFGRRRIDLGGQ